jgi:hypothetical protein
MRRPVIYISDILAWADAFHDRVGRWPVWSDGPVMGQIDLTWGGVNQALIKGNRGLRPGSSLAKLLLAYRGRRHKGLLPHYTTLKILAWADAHHRRTGEWPSCWDGLIADAPGETWLAVDKALRKGTRGQPGGSSLAQLLCAHRGVRNHRDLAPLTPEQILGWADALHSRTGAWPTRKSGPVPEVPGETWQGLHEALRNGRRGLPRSVSLARFLARHRGVRNIQDLPNLSVRRILAWADAHFERTGRWPVHTSGPIPGAPGETWGGIHATLNRGGRGFPPGGSLYRLLREHGRLRSKALPGNR